MTDLDLPPEGFEALGRWAVLSELADRGDHEAVERVLDQTDAETLRILLAGVLWMGAKVKAAGLVTCTPEEFQAALEDGE